jgi:hypothetical protein
VRGRTTVAKQIVMIRRIFAIRKLLSRTLTTEITEHTEILFKIPKPLSSTGV